jgi:hypothetical protein
MVELHMLLQIEDNKADQHIGDKGVNEQFLGQWIDEKRPFKTVAT